MARRKRKTRTHLLREPVNAPAQNPKSFVVKAGNAGPSVQALVRDVRDTMEPNTATRLRERKSNKLKDFIAMAGPLHVTHLLAFGQSDKEGEGSNVNLRIAKLPRGPTLTFRVLRYSLARDILAATKRPHSPGNEFQTDAMLILNGFNQDDRNVKLVATVFQNMFPAIKVQTMALTQARRVVLVSYNPVTRTIDFRHYLITVRPVGISKSVRRIIEGTNPQKRLLRASSVASNSTTASFAARTAKHLPNLSSAQDISDYIMAHNDLGFMSSASEAESDASDVEASDLGSGNEGTSSKVVRLPQRYVGRGNSRSEKRAIRLTELGPRMELGLIKIEDGVDGTGPILFHEYIKKSAKEIAAIEKLARQRKALKDKRRKEQAENVKRKKEEKESKKKAKAERRKAAGSDASESESGSDSEDDAIEEVSADDDEDGDEADDGFGGDFDLDAASDAASEEEPEEGERPAKKAKGSKFSLKAPVSKSARR